MTGPRRSAGHPAPRTLEEYIDADETLKVCSRTSILSASGRTTYGARQPPEGGRGILAPNQIDCRRLKYARNLANMRACSVRVVRKYQTAKPGIMSTGAGSKLVPRPES